MNKFFSLLTLLTFVCATVANGQLHWKPVSKNEVPAKPDHLVDDLAGMLSADEQAQLEQKLDRESDSTSNQIALLIIEDLNGYDISSLAFKIGDAWGIGGPNQDNGVLILVSQNDHAVFIATGKGMEGPIPDVTAKKIVDNIIVPQFKSGNYYQGLDEATSAIIKLAAGQFVDELQNKQTSTNGFPMGALPVIIIILLIIFSRINRGGRGGVISRRGFSPVPWILGGMLGRGLGRGGGFGGGGFGGGGFGGGGGGGGFGGFGGGGFGGGGAGGRW